jgi:hypothetical protein
MLHKIVLGGIASVLAIVIIAVLVNKYGSYGSVHGRTWQYGRSLRQELLDSLASNGIQMLRHGNRRGQGGRRRGGRHAVDCKAVTKLCPLLLK